MQAAAETPDPSGPALPGEDDCSLYQRSRSAAAALPLVSAYPALTLADSIAKAQHQQEEKRKKELVRERQKQKSHQATQDKFQGAVPGSDDEQSAYWMFVEAFFRDITYDDLVGLMPSCDELQQDPGLLMPPLGRSRARTAQSASLSRALERQRPAESLPSAVAVLAEEVAAQELGVASLPGSLEPEDADKLRKSRRISARASREAARQLPEDASSALQAQGVPREEVAQAQAAAASLEAGQSLLHACRPAELALLASQVQAGASMPEDLQQFLLGFSAAASPADSAVPRQASTHLLSWLQLQAGSAASPQLPDASREAKGPAEALASVQERGCAQLQAAPPSAAAAGSYRHPHLTAIIESQEQHAAKRPRTQLPSASNASSAAADASLNNLAPHAATVDQQLPPKAATPRNGDFVPGWAAASAQLPAANASFLGAPPQPAMQSAGQHAQASAAAETQLLPKLHSASMAEAGIADDSGAQQKVELPAEATAAVQKQSDQLPAAALTAGQHDEGQTLSGLLSVGAPQVVLSAASGQPHPPPSAPSSAPAGEPAAAAAEASLADRLNSSSAATPGPGSARASSSGRLRTAVNYSKLAGVKKVSMQTPVTKPPVKRPSLSKGQQQQLQQQLHQQQQQQQSQQLQQQQHQAVAASIAAGGQEGTLEQQWQTLGEAVELLAQAPEDEVTGQLLLLQAQLQQQAAANRRRVEGLLQKLLPDLPRQTGNAEGRAASVEFVHAFVQAQRACKRSAKRERREAQLREAAAAAVKEASMPSVPRKARGRASEAGGSHPPASLSPTPTPPPEALQPVYDRLASRAADEDSMCAVCGGGSSIEPNMIVFCERCDVAVHQQCYGVATIPEEDWLCWPCRKHEAELLAQGLPRSEVRPPRWQGSPGNANGLQGGSRSVTCALCPVMHGAFRQSLDGRDWIHQVCAMWHPETSVHSGGACTAIEGKSLIKADRWGRVCSLCRQSHGAIIRCNLGHCATAFHPLCARNAGLYLVSRPGTGGASAVHRAYCEVHSDMQRERDGSGDPAEMEARRQARAREREAQTAQAQELLGSHEQQRRQLLAVRMHMEDARVLLERVKRRERCKCEVAKAAQEVWRFKLGPALGLGAQPNPSTDPSSGTLGSGDAAGPAAQAPLEGVQEMSGRARRATERALTHQALTQRLSQRPRSASLNSANASDPSLQVNTHRMLTTAEASDLNAQLQARMDEHSKASYMYVPVHALRSPRPPSL